MEKKMEEGLEVIGKVKEAEEKYLEEWKAFHLAKLELEWQKAVRIVVIEMAIDDETGKKKYPNAETRKAALVNQFREEDKELLEKEFSMKMRLAEFGAEKRRAELCIEYLVMNGKDGLEELWEKEYRPKEEEEEKE